MADDRTAPSRRDRAWGFSDLFQTEGYRPRAREPDPVTGKLPEIRPPRGGSSVQRPRAGDQTGKAPPKI